MIITGCRSGSPQVTRDPREPIISTASYVLTTLDNIEKNPKEAKISNNMLLESLDAKAASNHGDYEKLQASAKDLKVAIDANNSTEIKDKSTALKKVAMEIAPEAKSSTGS
jgi:hypothetical protein